jgi:hypothetical protein
MKLIHLPTGEETEHPNYAAELLMAQYPAEYIRAELSQYWRVEGYDKSFDWFEMMVGRQPNDSRYQWITNKCSKSIKADAFFSSHGQLMQLPQISRAEFEHHIYNRWKKVQDGMSQLEKGISNSRLNEQPDMSDLDTLKQQAEKMGYELVRKEKLMCWVAGENGYQLDATGLKISDAYGECVWLDTPEIETLIEKYNQFKSNP